MTGQEKILSHALRCLRDKVAPWFPGESVEVGDSRFGEGVRLFVTGLEEERSANPHETLRVSGEEGEYRVPCPRMVSLSVALVPCFSDALKSLDGAALIKRNIYDDPYVALEDCLWHGCRESRSALEFGSSSRPLPGEYAPYEAFRWDITMRLGINSSREEKIVKVQERQFTAVSK